MGYLGLGLREGIGCLKEGVRRVVWEGLNAALVRCKDRVLRLRVVDEQGQQGFESKCMGDGLELRVLNV